MPKKKFIDKSKAVSFQLVHRSQQDPLVADETAPQRILLQQETAKNKAKRIEKQHKYGIYFDDDYNYLENLKDQKDNRVEWPESTETIESKLNEKVKIKLPSSVFASKVEENEGMLRKAAPIVGPQLHLDPELVAAMDDDFDYDDPETQLEDNFIELANGISSDLDSEKDEKEFLCDPSSDYNDEEMDEINSLHDSDLTFHEEETKSRFTNYSMTSSVIKRNEQLTLLDDRFEKMYANYDENEIGALDCEEIEGHVAETSNVLIQYAEGFEKEQKREQLENKAVLTKILDQLEMKSDNDNEKDDLIYMEIRERERWDCESILSTYSNIYNHPKLISEPNKQKIQINRKTGIPINILDGNKLTVKALNKLNEANECDGYCSNRDGGAKSIEVQSVVSQLSTLSVRPKNETPEQRKERKSQLKEYKRERRIEKKINTKAFKEEAKRQAKININNKNIVQGNKIL